MARMDRKAQRESQGRLVLVFLARRASAVCANHLSLVAAPPASKCLTEQEANQAFQVHLDFLVSELMENRAHQVLLVQKEKRVNVEIREIREWTELLEPQDCPESLVGMDQWA